MKNLLTFILVAIALQSFAQNNEAIYKKALTTHNKKTVDYFFQALEQKDYKLLEGIIDYEATWITANPRDSETDTIFGRELVVRRLQEVYKDFNKINFGKEVNIMEDPALLMVRFKGNFINLAAEELESNSVVVFRLKNGKITEYMELNNPTLIAKGAKEQ